jgi:hypothetical protein
VIRFVNERLIPVWVDIREEPFPEAAALQHYGSEWDLLLSPDRTVCNIYYRCYMSRSYVLSPDLEQLLNKEAGVLGMSMTEIGDDYLAMIRAAADRYTQGVKSD